MKSDYILGFLMGFMCVLLIVVIVMVIKYRCGTLKEKYDERQTAKRGVAFKVVFFTLMISGFLIAVADEMLGNKGLLQMTAMTITICIGTAAFAAYSIWSDAYVGINHKDKKSTYLCLTLLFLCNGFISIVHVIESKLVTFTDQGIDISLNFVVTILLGFVLVNALFKKISEQKEGDYYEKPEA